MDMTGLRKIGALITLVSACSGSRDTTSPGAKIDRDLPIGSACTAEDGWQASGGPCDGGTGPTACPVGPGYVDETHLPSGIRFCVVNSPIFPGGYFTSNCAADG